MWVGFGGSEKVGGDVGVKLFLLICLQFTSGKMGSVGEGKHTR